MIVDVRASEIASGLRAKIGDRIYSGPFEGVLLPLDNMAGNYAPYLLGTYESELHSIIRYIISTGYKRILNIGCGFGYYAVGLAINIPDAEIFAVDTDLNVLDVARLNAEINSVADRVHCIAAYDTLADYDLIIMDAEGAEEQLLYPTQADVLVELHECIDPLLPDRIVNRFEHTHTITIIPNNFSYFDLRKIFGPELLLHHLDNALATYEGRAGRTPWAWMTKIES